MKRPKFENNNFWVFKQAINEGKRFFDDKNIEIEAKISNGLDKKIFMKIMNNLYSCFSWQTIKKNEQTTDIYAYNKTRSSFNHNGILKYSMKKNILWFKHTDFNEFSIKTTVSHEIKVDNQIITKKDIFLKRIKKRTTFVHRSGRCPFKIDLTIVDNISYELELELFSWVFEIQNESEIETWCKAWWFFLTNLLEHAKVDETYFPDFENLYLSHSNVNSKFFHSNQMFFGTMPIPFQRSRMAKIDPKNYVLSEKTDGKRFFMYIQDDGVWLINRKMEFYAVHQKWNPLTKFCQTLKTPMLIDGEVVKTPFYETKTSYMQSVGSYSYIAFDILIIGGNNIESETFYKRQEILSQRFLSIVYNVFRCVPMAFPFFISKKKFFDEADQLERLLKKTNNGSYLYTEINTSDGSIKKYHNTDGIIITHKGKYCHRAKAPFTYKWKFQELITADFRIIIQKNRMYALQGWLKNNQHVTLIQSSELPFTNNSKFLNDLNDVDLLNPKNVIIVELSFDKSNGNWKYVKIRNEKHNANHITVLFSIMEEIAEDSLTIKDIVKFFKKKKL